LNTYSHIPVPQPRENVNVFRPPTSASRPTDSPAGCASLRVEYLFTETTKYSRIPVPQPRGRPTDSPAGCASLRVDKHVFHPGAFSGPHKKTSPDNKKTVTKRATYSIRLHPAFINLPLKISSGDKSGRKDTDSPAGCASLRVELYIYIYIYIYIIYIYIYIYIYTYICISYT